MYFLGNFYEYEKGNHMLHINFIVITFLFTRILSAETASIPEKDVTTEEYYSNESSYSDIKLPRDQDMYFPDPDEGKMLRTEKGAVWKSKKGNFDISVSIDDKDPYDDFRTEWRKNETKDELKKKRKN